MEEAPPHAEGEEGWYLPTFGTCHLHKAGETRVVVANSAQYESTLLNSVMLTSADFTNCLLGVPKRFIKALSR